MTQAAKNITPLAGPKLRPWLPCHSLRSWLVILLAFFAFVSAKSDPPAVNYSWSLSGEQYAMVSYNLEPIAPRLWFAAFGGVNTNNFQPVSGFGLAYELNRDRYFLGVNAGLLFGQNRNPDLALGVSFGVKF